MKTESLPVPLTESEIAERAQRMADAIRKIDELDVKLKEHKTEVKATREELERDIRDWATQVREKAEHREVEIDVRSNWELGTMETWRLDTGEIVRSRPMTPAEHQRTFEHPSLRN